VSDLTTHAVLSFGIETVSRVTGDCAFNPYMTPEMRQAENNQRKMADKLATLSEKLDSFGGALQRVCALPNSTVLDRSLVCQSSPCSVAPPSFSPNGLSSEQGAQLIALLQQLTQQQATAATGVSPMQLLPPTTAQVTPNTESSLAAPSANRKRHGDSEAGSRKRRQPSMDASTAGHGEPLPTLSTLEQYVTAYPDLSAPTAKARFAVQGGALSAHRCKAKCFHDAVKRRMLAGMTIPAACLRIVQALRPNATMVHHGNLTDLFLLMTRERQSMCAYARFLAGEISDPKTMNEVEFRDAHRDHDTLTEAAKQKMRSLCNELYGNDRSVESNAKASLANHTPDHCATLRTRTANVKLWT
jgi:hypothetical protein